MNSLTLLRPTQPSTDSGWKMSTSFGWGSKFSCALVGLARNTCRAALCAVPRTPGLPNNCQHCKATLDIVCKCRYIKNTYFTLLIFRQHWKPESTAPPGPFDLIDSV